MLTVIETYDPAPASYPGLDGTWPAAAVVEDDNDGTRWMISSIPGASEHHWRRALAAGAAGICLPASATGWHAATADRYAAIRTGQAAFDPTVWPTIPELWQLAQAETTPVTRPGNGYVALHTHTENSPMDGMTRVAELVDVTAAQGGHAVGITDHGYCTGHAELHIRATAAGIKPVYGLEAYLVDDIAQRGASNDYWHLILLAADDQGLQNLWAASTESHRRGFHYKPRMDWEMLTRYAPGLIATTACLGGPVSQAILADDRQTAAARMSRLQQIFEDRLYAEIHTYPTADQRKVNEALTALAGLQGVPLVGAADSHYPAAADHAAHQVWIASATNKTVGETGMFTDGAFHLHTADEIRAALDYLPPDAVQEALDSTVHIADTATAEVRTRKVLPVYGRGATHDDDAARLRQLALDGWQRRFGLSMPRETAQAYRERFDREMNLLVEQKFCGYFLIVADYVGWAKDNGILVGPGRGSGGASLIAYLTRITEIDPVRWDLPFERFLTPGRVSLPDFDIDFPASQRAAIFAYLARRWGDEHVVSIGTVSRLRNRGVAKELERALRPTLPHGSFTDMEQVSKIIEEAEAGTAGLGLSWEDLWVQHGDRLTPYRQRYPSLFAYADRLVGLLKTYGKHAAGAVISTDAPLTGAMPLRGGEDGGRMITQFDDDGVEMLGHVKYDVLTLRHLDTIQKTVALIAQRTGQTLDLYGLERNHLDDTATWDLLCSGEVAGCFQIETTLGVRTIKALRPRNLGELADVITLVRPGPRNSGITHAYLARRDGHEPVTVPDPRLADILAPTYGTMIYQEQVLAICRIIAGHDDAQADDVRKILGKKQVEKIDAAGRDFLARAIERGMERNHAHLLWNQMAEFSKYAFGKAHAYAYALLTWWTAYLKAHHPVEFMTATLSTIDTDRIPAFVKEARRLGIPVLPPDVNISDLGFSIDGTAVRYGLQSLKGIGEAAAIEIIEHAPYTSVDDLITRTGRAVTRGTVAVLARAGALDSLEPHRAALLARLEAEASGASKRCAFKTDADPADGLPCTYDWATEWEREPVPVNPRTGKKLPGKPPPKRCTTACRRYTAPSAVDVQLIPRLTPEQIGRIELETFGLYLTWSPFDRMQPQIRDFARTEAAAADSVPGEYAVLALVESMRPYTTSGGLQMGFVQLATEGPDLDTVAFTKVWGTLRQDLTGQLVSAAVQRTDRGLTLLQIMPIERH